MNPVETLVRDCEASGVGRRVVLVRGAGHGRSALDAALDALSRHGRVRRHLVGAGMVAAWWHGDNPAWPGAFAHLPQGVRAELFDLPADADALLDALPATASSSTPQIGRGTPLDQASLAEVERGLAGADVSRFMRRAPVLRHGPAGVELAWEKRYLHLPELADTLAPGRDLLACRTRLRQLGGSLETRTLRHMSGMDILSAVGPFAINMGVRTLAGPEFARFDAVLPARLRGEVVLVLSPDDVLADPPEFARVREDMRRRRYRLMLRGISAGLARALVFDRLGFDFVGLRWSRDLPATGAGWGGAAVVLAGVDGPAALRWAARHGVTLFAGTAKAAAVPQSEPRNLDARVSAA